MIAMKFRITLIIAAALVTLLFTFASVNSAKHETAAETAKTAVEEPVGGLVSEGKL
jgi:hypothetical protein